MSVDRAAVFSSGSRDRGLPISQLFLGQPPAVQVLTEGYEKDGSGSGLLLGSEFSVLKNPTFSSSPRGTGFGAGLGAQEKTSWKEGNS